MTGPFKEDKIKNEKADPVEASSMKFVRLPIILLSAFIGFGVTYLALRTDSVQMSPGDTRTQAASPDTSSGDGTPAGSLAASPEQILKKGKQVFATTCQACHQASGAGIPGAFPPLDGSEWVSGNPARLAAIVLHGLNGEITVKGQKFMGAMPAFGTQLPHEDIAAVTTYIRSAWSNKASTVDVATVEAAAKKTQAKTTPWVGQAELDQQNWD